MWIYRRVDLKKDVRDLKYISFIGAGGKTSLIKYLASNLAGIGKRVAITTTTKIYAEEPYILLEQKGLGFKNKNPIFIGKSLEEGKLTALNEDEIKDIARDFDVILIEADGAKRKPLKYPAPHEPVIPDVTEKVFVLAGLDALYRKVKDIVFRWQIFSHDTGISSDEFVTPEMFISLFSSKGLLKGTEGKIFSVLLNKFDLCVERNMAFHIAKHLIRRLKPDGVFVASIDYNMFYKIDALKQCVFNFS